MNEDTLVFKPDDVTVELDGTVYRLYFDLNSFCEMEKIYESVDSVLQMLLGTSAVPDMSRVVYKNEPVEASDITISGESLVAYINKINNVKAAKHSDTLNMLWLGCLHDHSIIDENGEIIGYSITKSKLGAGVTFKNLREVNGKILMVMLRDLIPPTSAKNAEVPTEVEEPKVALHK